MMFSTQGAVANRSNLKLDVLFSDELVVVGRVPMNKKSGQRQLQRIARNQEAQTRVEPHAQPKQYAPAARGQRTQPTPAARGQQRKPPTPAAVPKQQRTPAARQRPPARSQERPAVCTSVPLAQRGAHDHRALTVLEPRAVVVGRAVAAGAAAALPAETLALVASLTGCAGAGALAATGRALHASCWGPDSRAFWQGLALGQLPAAPGQAPWDSFRVWRFALGPGWLPALEQLAQREPLAGLARACAVSTALLRADRAAAAAVLSVACAVAPAAPAAPALALLDAVLPKLQRRPEVFPCLAGAAECRGALEERRILAQLDAHVLGDQEAMAFDYFAPQFEEPALGELGEAGAFWDELESLAPAPCGELPECQLAAAAEPAIEEGVSRALAAEFLEAMGLHHGFAWQEAAAAVEAH